MTGKLMKYELRSMLRTFLPMWGILLVVALLNRFTLQIDSLQGWLNGIPTVILMIVYVISVMAVAIIALVFMIQRFYNGLLKDEGYLMFTLPVKASQLIWAKCLTAAILMAGTILVCVLSVMVMAVSNDVILTLRDGINEIMITDPEMFREYSGVVIQAVVCGLVVGFASMVKSIMQAYLSMSIGQLANKHRVGFSVLAYIGISIAMSTIGTIAINSGLFDWFESIDVDLFDGVSVSGALWIVMGMALLLEVIQLVIFYFPTNYILKNKLNLE